MAYTTIDDSEIYFKQITYTGTGNVQALEGLNHKPDFLWVKNRSVNNDFKITDSMRLSSGAPTITLESNTSAAEYDDADPASTTSFDTDGFTIGTNGNYNTDDSTYVGWSWKCNGGTAETTVNESGNNPGNSRQTNADAGFSIITYTGTGATGTIAHGLGVVPEWIMFKARAGTENWPNYQITTGNTHGCDLNRNNAQIDNDTLFNDTSPTSSVFTVSSDSAINADGVAYVCYCFAPIKGYSKFGGYTGNGNVNGAFVYTGFSPAWVMVKRTDSGNNWHMHDNKRVTSNPNNLTLYANLTNADASEDLDMLSNGFKLRESGGGYNANAGTYVYMAFAASPFVSSKGIPTTAK